MVLDEEVLNEEALEEDALDGEVLEEDALDEEVLDEEALDEEVLDEEALNKEVLDEEVLDKEVLDEDSFAARCMSARNDRLGWPAAGVTGREAATAAELEDEPAIIELVAISDF